MQKRESFNCAKVLSLSLPPSLSLSLSLNSLLLFINLSPPLYLSYIVQGNAINKGSVKCDKNDDFIMIESNNSKNNNKKLKDGNGSNDMLSMEEANRLHIGGTIYNSNVTSLTKLKELCKKCKLPDSFKGDKNEYNRLSNIHKVSLSLSLSLSFSLCIFLSFSHALPV